MKLETFNIETDNNNEIVKDLIDSIDFVVDNNLTGFILDVNKTKFTTIEKFVYDTAIYHLNRSGKTFDEEKYYIETSVHKKLNKQIIHLDLDVYNYTKYNDNKIIDESSYNYALSKGLVPFTTIITYFEDNYLSPLIVTNIDKEKLLNKNFDNSEFHISFPRILKNVVFKGGKYFHLGKNLNKQNEKRHNITICIWKNEDIAKEKLRYLNNNIFPEKLFYNVDNNIAIKYTNRIFILNEYYDNSKTIFYDKNTLSNNDIENFFQNKNFKKIKNLINHPDLSNCHYIVLKPLELNIEKLRNRDPSIIVLSVATDPKNKGLQYFIKSLKKQYIPYKLLGLNHIWNGGNLEKYQGGGQKINILKRELQTWDIETLKSRLLLFSDSYDVINVSNESEIIQKYKRISNGSVLFSSEKYCWPDENLKQYYTETNSEYKYLNSGGFIGNAYDILNLLQNEIKDDDDDKVYFTNIFLFDNKNKNPKIKLDYNCEIFQTLNGTSIQDIYFYKNRIVNKYYNTMPCVIIGNIISKNILLNIF